MNRSSPDDPDLPMIRAIGKGDTQALQTLYDRYGADILSFLIIRLQNRHLAEEILQDVMLAVWKGAATFRGESRVRTWLMRIARNHAFDAFNHHKHVCLPLNEAITSDATSVSATVDRTLLQEQIDGVYLQLSDDQQEVVELVLYQGLTYVEAAGLLGVPEGTVKSRLYHARQTMRRLLQMEGITHA